MNTPPEGVNSVQSTCESLSTGSLKTGQNEVEAYEICRHVSTARFWRCDEVLATRQGRDHTRLPCGEVLVFGWVWRRV